MTFQIPPDWKRIPCLVAESDFQPVPNAHTKATKSTQSAKSCFCLFDSHDTPGLEAVSSCVIAWDFLSLKQNHHAWQFMHYARVVLASFILLPALLTGLLSPRQQEAAWAALLHGLAVSSYQRTLAANLCFCVVFLVQNHLHRCSGAAARTWWLLRQNCFKCFWE